MKLETEIAETATSPKPATAPVPPRRRWQFSLRMILLATAAVGVWTAMYINRREIPLLQRRIDAMRPLARELLVKDESKIAVVKCEEAWYDENEWLVYLPTDGFQLALATQQIDKNDALPAPAKTAPLPAGRFRLALMQEKHNGGWRVRVTKDGEEFLTADEPLAWYPGRGSIGGGNFTTCQQFAPTQQVVLFHRRFSHPMQTGPGTSASQVPTNPSEGVALWIEPVAKPK